MDKFLKYAVLQYAPISRKVEKIVLGVLFHEEEIDHREFRHIDDFSRLAQFDDALDLKMIEKLLRGIKDEVESDEFKHKSFDIDEYTRFYINDYYFEDTKYVRYDTLDGMIEEIAKVCLI